MIRMQNKFSSRKVDKAAFKLKAAGAWEIIVDAVDNFRINGDANQAAAIAFYAILSVIPLLILTFVAAGYFFSSNPHLQDEIILAIREFNPYFSEELLVQLGQMERKKQLLGWVGVLGLVWLSTMIFNSMSTALNIIFRSSKKRNYFEEKLLAISMIPMAWIVGIISVGLSSIVAILVKKSWLLPGGFELSLGGMPSIMLRYVVPFLMTALFFNIIYRTIPTAKIRPTVTMIGGAAFALLMEIAKQLFAWYVTSYSRYNVIFGSLESIVILVIWVFYVALIFLFCAEIMSSYGRRDLLLMEKALLDPHKANLKIAERLLKKFGRTYPAGSMIFNEGDAGQEMYYILSGRVCLEKEAGQVKKTLTELGSGEYFGEMAALIRATRTASARALEESHLAVIDNANFSNLVKESQEVALFMLREFSRRLKNANAALEELTSLWIRLVMVIYFMENTGVDIEEHLPRLAEITNKETSEIREVLSDPLLTDIFTIRDGFIVDVARKDVWRLLDSVALAKCDIDAKEKVRS